MKWQRGTIVCGSANIRRYVGILSNGNGGAERKETAAAAAAATTAAAITAGARRSREQDWTKIVTANLLFIGSAGRDQLLAPVCRVKTFVR